MSGNSRVCDEGVAARLEALRGARVFFEPLGGNNGDRLIQLGSTHAMAGAGLDLVPSVAEADAVVVNGGGAIGVEMWSPGLCLLARECQRAPDKPLVILPSSFYAPVADLAGCLAGRRAPVWLFARERYSAAVLEGRSYPVETHLGTDHDMAFALRGSRFLAELRARAAQRHVLVVERLDSESSTGRREAIARLYPLRKRLPRRLLPAVKRLAAVWFQRSSGFARDACDRLNAEDPALAGLPVVNADISFARSFTFDEFTDLIAGAAAIATTRLHVGILGALLGKRVLLKADAGPYRKIRGVYELSLADQANVTLI